MHAAATAAPTACSARAGPRFPTQPGSPSRSIPASRRTGAHGRCLTSRVMVFPVRVFTKICMARPAGAARGGAERRGRSAGCRRCSRNGGGGPRERRACPHGVSVRAAGGGRAARRDYNSRHAPPAAAAAAPDGRCSPATGLGGSCRSHSASRWA